MGEDSRFLIGENEGEPDNAALCPFVSYFSFLLRFSRCFSTSACAGYLRNRDPPLKQIKRKLFVVAVKKRIKENDVQVLLRDFRVITVQCR